MIVLCISIAGVSAKAQNIIYDNGPADLGGGYSILENPRRSLLDDFELPPGGGVVNGWSTWMIWDTLQGVGHADRVELTFYSDIHGKPNFNDQLAFVSTTDIVESLDGRQFFGRDLIILSVGFTDVAIPDGRLWIDAIWFNNADDNAFMVAQNDTINYTPCWTDYEDFPPPGPGDVIFGINKDLVFTLYGTPTYCLDLTIDNLIAGEQATFTITGGTPNKKAITVYGLQSGSTVIDNIAGYCATFEIQNINQNKIIGGINRTFDSNGEITFNLMIPNEAAGIEVFIQTAQKNTCPEECMSNLIEAVVE